MPRGGKRPGAGAPRGNLNGLKSGRHSRRVRALKLALQAAPATATVLRGLGAAGGERRLLFAMALQYYAELILAGDPVATQSIETGQIDPGLIREFIENAKFNQAIKRAKA